MKNIAVITGATSGLGTEYARQLAEMNYDLLLVARRENMLQEVKREIESRSGVNVEYLVCDLAQAGEVRQLESRLESMDNLEVMVNNAGFGRESGFPNVNADDEEEMIRVHAVSLMRLSRSSLVPMCKRRKGYLINVASVAAFLHGKNSAEYCATKAYVLSLSKSIQSDVAGHGVRVQALCPGFTHTGFHDTAAMKASFRKDTTPGFLWLSAPFVVRSSLRSIRGFWHRVVCIPSFRYKFLIFTILFTNLIGLNLSDWGYAIRARKKQDDRSESPQERRIDG